MKKYIIKTLTIIMILLVILTNFSFAIDWSKADNFIQKGQEQSGDIDVTQAGTEFAAIGNALKLIGAGIIIAATAYMGIQYMISSPEKQAKLKQQLIGLVVATFVIFGGYYIWKIITTALDTMTTTA